MKLETDRLCLCSPDQVKAELVVEYLIRNREFLREFEPEREDAYYTIPFQQRFLRKQTDDWQKKTEYRFYITPREDRHKVIGDVALSTVVMGPVCSCFLGYQIDHGYMRQGLMTEAVTEVVRYGFAKLGLHRVEGNVMPKNKASIGLLKKCGFTEEGISRNYLRIRGVWEDHIHFVKLNQDME